MEFADSKLKKNPKAYIDFLQSQNRVKKQNELKDKEKIINKQKEDAFNIYLQGANEKRVDNQRKREKGLRLREKSLGVNLRKKWAEEAPKPIIKPKVENPHPDAFFNNFFTSRSESLQNFYDFRETKPNFIEKTPKEQIVQYLKTFDEDKLARVLEFLNTLITNN